MLQPAKTPHVCLVCGGSPDRRLRSSGVWFYLCRRCGDANKTAEGRQRLVAALRPYLPEGAAVQERPAEIEVERKMHMGARIVTPLRPLSYAEAEEKRKRENAGENNQH